MSSERINTANGLETCPVRFFKPCRTLRFGSWWMDSARRRGLVSALAIAKTARKLKHSMTIGVKPFMKIAFFQKTIGAGQDSPAY